MKTACQPGVRSYGVSPAHDAAVLSEMFSTGRSASFCWIKRPARFHTIIHFAAVSIGMLPPGNSAGVSVIRLRKERKDHIMFTTSYPTLEIAAECDFPRIYEIMEEAFPPSERRTREGQKKLWASPHHQVLIRREPLSDGKIAGFIAWWDFDDAAFIEHFAVDSSLRGGGLGSRILQEFLHHVKRPVFLEAEPPETETARRRVAFYQRMGFQLNDFPYQQPSLQPGQPPVPLKIMTYPSPVDRETFEKHIRVAVQVARTQ